MTSHNRVLAACGFRRPDRIPRFESFWWYPDDWMERLGPREDVTDVGIWSPNEGTFPSRARHIKEEGGWIYEVDCWGRTMRRKGDAYFVETLDVPLPPGIDIDSVQFEPPDNDSRFEHAYCRQYDVDSPVEQAKKRHCVFGKTGGPFLRTTFVRGEEQFLMDIAQDPPLARAIAEKMADHLAVVGAEAIRRWSLQDTGMWIYDDMAYNDGPLFSPTSFEKVFLPAYRLMVRAYKDAGAKYVMLHSDGDIRPILDMLIDAGIQGIHPLERRASMDIADIRRRYPNLVLAGGMCNTNTLLRGPTSAIEAEARQIIDLGRDGGVIIGTHSISPEVPVEHYAAYHEVCRTYGVFEC